MTHKHQSLKDNHQLNIKAILVPICVSLILFAVKTYGYFVTGSLSILTSLLDSMMDVIISSLNMAAIIYAAKPADADHSFGHNSIEDIMGLMQATFIATSAFFILYKAGINFMAPQAINHNMIGAWVMIFSFAFASIIVLYQKMILAKTNSVVVESDMLHYLSDVLINGAIIISLFLASNPNLKLLDPILASVIAFYILFSAFKIGKRSFDNLMDKELENGEREQIENLIKKEKQIKGYHALRTRRSGNRIFVQLHIDLDKGLSLEEAHDIIDSLEKKIAAMWLEADVIIHTDPV